MILTKLPEETKKNMARDNTTTTWTIEELQAAIMKELRVFEVGQQTSTLMNQPAIPAAAFYTGTNKKTGHRDTNSKPSCAYCKGTHFAINCDVSKDVPSCIEVIKKKHLCFKDVLTALLITVCHSAPQKTAAAHAVENTTQVFVMSLTRLLITQNTPLIRKAQIRPTRTVIHLQTPILIL